MKQLTERKRGTFSWLVIFGAAAYILYYHLEISTKLTNLASKVSFPELPKRQTNAAKRQKKILYLTQCASCLSQYHLSKDVLGGGESFDVLVLSYDKPCNENNMKHISYLNSTVKTTWTGGRNLLYRHSHHASNHSDKQYLYYVFIDCDISLTKNYLINKLRHIWNPQTQAMMEKNQSVWRQYEEFLLNYRPQISALETPSNMRTYLKQVQQKNNPLKSLFWGLVFDAAFNAFRHDIILRLLPYNARFERRSWWASQQNMQCRVFIKFYAQLAIPVTIMAENAEHSKYPRKILPVKTVCRAEINQLNDSNLVKQIARLKDFPNECKRYIPLD